MLTTTPALIGFGIWILIAVASWLSLLKTYNGFGLVVGTVSPIIVGILLYTQSWNIFFWYALIMVPTSGFLPLTKRQIYLSAAGHIGIIAFGYIMSFGAYGILSLLNKP